MNSSPKDAFHVPAGLHFFGTLIEKIRPFWINLGNLETRYLDNKLEDITIDAPVYIGGLARSGSTLLLEILAAHHQVVTHRYSDFPPIFTPYLWHLFQRYMPKRKTQPVERTHKDGMMVTPDSPEALEEVLWMAFFDTLHDSGISNVLDKETQNPLFEKFYKDHLKKLLLIHDKSRYVTKGNYNSARFEYIQQHFPDAKFIIPVRDPITHIASLQKQHRLFCEGEEVNPNMLSHLNRVGHFEFGLGRLPVNAGNDKEIKEIIALWNNGKELEGWARYWSHIYGYLADMLANNHAIKQASLVVRYEDLCEEPGYIIEKMLTHCNLMDNKELIQSFADRIHFPSYYTVEYSDKECALIKEYTAEVAQKFSYTA